MRRPGPADYLRKVEKWKRGILEETEKEGNDGENELGKDAAILRRAAGEGNGGEEVGHDDEGAHVGSV